jgi:hypothetical protein
LEVATEGDKLEERLAMTARRVCKEIVAVGKIRLELIESGGCGDNEGHFPGNHNKEDVGQK